MTKYIITLLVLIAAGGLFLFAQMQVAEAPTVQEQQEQKTEQNPFGDGSTTVGSLEENPDSENEKEDDDSSSNGTQPGTGNTDGTGTVGVVSRAQLASHNKQSDCWVAYKGVVYDITSWLPRHPGSASAIAPYCGKAEEFTTAFNKMHGTSKDARLQKEGTVEGKLGN